MQFRGDERGQAIQIGAVLLLGALVISFSLYQALVVPDQNREIEFNHNQQVQGQLQELRNGIVSTAGGGDGRSVSVQLGTRYPSRVIALNPGPPSGTLTTVGTTDASINATVANAAATGEVGDYWTGANKTFNTGSLRYRPGYNEYTNAPVTWYEHSVLFNRFRDSNLTLTGQRLIDGTDITLVTLNGSYYADRSGSVSVDVRAVSAGATTVSVTNATPTSNVTITLPTHLSERDWEELLRGERESGYVADVSTHPVANASYQLLRVELERGPTYDLQLARAGVGTNVVETGAAYLTDVAGNGSSVPEGGTTQLTVEVRDRLDNPVGGVGVTAGTRRGDSSVSPASADSDDDGEVTLTYRAPADISGVSQRTDLVNASIDVPASAVDDPAFDPETPLNVTMVVRVDNSDGSGLGGGGGGDSAYSIDWQDPTQTGVTCDPAGDPDGVCTVNASRAGDVDLTALTDPTAQGATVDFSLNNSTVGSLSPTETTTDSTGEATTTFAPEANGSVAAFVASGGSGDRLDLVVENVAPAGDGFRTLRATSMPPYSGSQRQNVTLVPSSDVPAGETITVELSDPQQSSPLQVAYNGPKAAIVRGGSSVSVSDTTTIGGDRAFVNLSVDSTLPAGTPVELRLKQIRVGAPATQTDPYDVSVDRSDTADTGTTAFTIAYDDGLSALSGTSASDLQSGQSGQIQTVSFTLGSRLDGGNQTLIELSDPQGAVDYSNVNSVTFASGSDGTGGSLSLITNNDNATLLYTAPSGGLAAGSTVEIEIDGVDTAPESTSEGTYTVGFSREDADVAGANYTVGAAPSVTVQSPNGGENVSGGSTYTIEWDASDGGTGIQSVDLAYSTNDGGSYTTIATGLSNTGSYDWSVPEVDTDQARVRVTATDGAGNTASDASDGSFTIDSTDPSVTVESPDGGEVLRGGSTYTVQWTASDVGSGVAAVDLAYSTDNGSSYTTFASGVTNDGAYDWSVPDVNTDRALIRVTATDYAGNSQTDTSNSTFTIDGTAPSVTVQDPSGGETIAAGSTYTINWTASDGETSIATDSVDLAYSTDNGSTYTAIATNVSNTGSYDWSVPDVDTDQAKVRVTAADAAGNTGTDASGRFTIQTPPNVTVAIDGTNSPVVEGEDLLVNATIENVGGSEATQDITLDADGDGVAEDTKTRTLSSGESQQLTLAWNTTSGDAGVYTANVSSANDSDTTGVTVTEPANFTVSIDSTNEPVVEGETLVVNATIENTGGTQDTQTVTLDVGGAQRDNTSLTLAPGDTAGVNLTWTTTSGDGGTYTANVSSEDDFDTTTVTVQEPPNFTVSIDSVDDPVDQGDVVDVVATIENTGDLSDTQTVTLDVSGIGVVDSTTLTLAGGDSTTRTFQWNTTNNETGTYDLTVASENTSDTATTRVNGLEFTGDSIAFDDSGNGINSSIAFGLVNNRSDDVTLTAVTIESTSTTAVRIDNDDGSEVLVDVNGDSFADYDAEGGGNGYDIGTRIDLTGSGSLVSGDTALWNINGFKETGGRPPRGVSMDGETVTITVAYEDSSGVERTSQFTIDSV